MTIQPPAPPYAGPPAHSSGDGNKPIERVVIHCTVSACGVGARDIAAYFRSSKAGGSAHYVVDSDETIQAAWDSVVCWHAPPNSHSLGVELCCTLADQGKGHWTRADHVAMLERTATLVAQLCLAYGVPIVKLSPADLKAGKRGICGHVDVSQAWGQTTHWDPGPFFPWSEFMDRVKAAAKRLQQPEPDVEHLPVAHVSMQYSDTEAQMRADANAIFGRAVKAGLAWVTGTEAGEQPLRSILAEAADAHGYRFHANRGQWIAVDRGLIKGGWETGYVPVLESFEGRGKHTDRGVTWVAFDTANLGRVTVGCGHYLTDGRKPGDPNYALNREYAATIGTWAREAGEGSALVFYHGDQNINDRKDDTFHGSPMTSAADELRRHESTGPGPIDVIASYDSDGRVTARDIRVLDDSEFRLNTDHFFVVAVFDIRVLR